MKGFNFLLILFLITSCGDPSAGKRGLISSGGSDSTDANGTPAKYESLCSILVLPKNPVPGEPFRILTTGGENIGEAQVIVTGPSGRLKSMKSKTGDEL